MRGPVMWWSLYNWRRRGCQFADMLLRSTRPIAPPQNMDQSDFPWNLRTSKIEMDLKFESGYETWWCKWNLLLSWPILSHHWMEDCEFFSSGSFFSCPVPSRPVPPSMEDYEFFSSGSFFFMSRPVPPSKEDYEFFSSGSFFRPVPSRHPRKIMSSSPLDRSSVPSPHVTQGRLWVLPYRPVSSWIIDWNLLLKFLRLSGSGHDLIFTSIWRSSSDFWFLFLEVSTSFLRVPDKPDCFRISACSHVYKSGEVRVELKYFDLLSDEVSQNFEV